MFTPKKSYQMIRNTTDDEIKNISSTCILFEHDIGSKLPTLYRNLTQLKCDSRYFYLNVAEFTNIRWVLETTNRAGGGLFSLVTLGAIRQIMKTPILVGEWKGQTFDISRLYEMNFPDDILALEEQWTGYPNQNTEYLQE